MMSAPLSRSSHSDQNSEAGATDMLISSSAADLEIMLQSPRDLSEAERQQILTDWNATARDVPRDQCLHHLVEEQVERTPEALAVVFDDQELTYRELNCRANILAHDLHTRGVGPDVLVGLCMERSLELVVGILGILKAGGAYVPLDPSYPPERLAFILSDAHLPFLVTQKLLWSELDKHLDSTSAPQTIYLDKLAELESELASPRQDNLSSSVTPQHLAYVLYTSGSTGQPKGVAIEHHGPVALMSWGQRVYSRTELAGVLAATSVCFDLSVYELFLPLTVGGTVIMAQNALQLPTLPQRDQVTLVNTVPSAMEELVRQQGLPASVQTINLAGEPLTRALVDRLYAIPTVQKVYDLYGPSEDTTYSTWKLRQPNGTVTIGRPLDNTQAYILDDTLAPVPVGEMGELYLAGAGLARGYLHRPGLTAEKFIENPFGPGHLYKTGDLARWFPNGEIEYLGRRDHQVKIRGFRIELGEIESTLDQHPVVQEAVVLAREDTPGEKRLVAYIVPTTEGDTSAVEGMSWQDDFVTRGQTVYDQIYSQEAATPELAFNLIGWTSSYTGQPIPQEEMQEWVCGAVDRILSLQPQRVLEIGCGTGMLLARIAPSCTAYWGTDYSATVIQQVEQMTATVPGLEHVKLFCRTADDFSGISDEQFDTIVINGVVQHFPSIDYLLRVLDGLVDLVAKAGGAIFFGGVRSLPLLSAYHASVQSYQAPTHLTPLQLQQRVNLHLAREEELVIDPVFWTALTQRFPQIRHVQVQPTRGQSHNELTRFRYDVCLHVGAAEAASLSETNPKMTWLDWAKEMSSVSSLHDYLVQHRPEVLGLHHVPNARLQSALRTLAWLNDPEGIDSVGEFRDAISTQHQDGVELETLFEMGHDLSYRVETSWANGASDGALDVIFQLASHPEPIAFPPAHLPSKSWSAYGNHPLQSVLASELIPQIRAFVEEKLPDYMMPSAFVILDALPLTPNGKRDRQALPAPTFERPSLTSQYEAPQTEMERNVAGLWRQVLQVDQVGRLDNFLELGGNSLLAIQVVARLREMIQLELPLPSLLEEPTLEQLAQRIETMLETDTHRSRPIQSLSRPASIPLSYFQEQLWFLSQLYPDTPVYNEPLTIHIKREVDIAALEQSLNEVLRRHEALRTNFELVDGQPRQVIAPASSISLQVIDLLDWPDSERETEAHRIALEQCCHPFDLATDLSLRAILIKLGEADYRLCLTVHHINVDGPSMFILFRELYDLYDTFTAGRPSPLPDLPVQYADFAVWQRCWIEQEGVDAHLAYWRDQLGGELPVLQLPTDRPRPAVPSFQGAKEQFVLPKSLSESLQALSRQEGTTLFMTLLAAFQTLLYRYTGQDDILVGTPLTTHQQQGTENLIGYLVNMLVVRSDLSGEPTFQEFLSRVREVTLAAYAHQDMPFDLIVRTLQPERDLRQNPLFQVGFGLNAPMPSELGWTSTYRALDPGRAKFDLFLELEDRQEGLHGYLEYSTELFSPDTIVRMVDHFKQVLTGIVSNPRDNIASLPLLTETERDHILYAWNDTIRSYPQDKSLPELFEEQAERTPDAVAVVFDNQPLTYRDLNQRANQLARYLLTVGVRPQGFVGLCVERSLELLVGLLGIQKAGGAYVPLDPAYPQERIAYILTHSEAQVLITQDKLTPTLPGTAIPKVYLDTDWEVISRLADTNLDRRPQPTDLAYVIYTSGSTGQPKGVEIEHRSLVNFLVSMQQTPGLSSTDVMVAVTTICFDIAALELYLPLLVGAQVVIASQAETMDGRQLSALLDTSQATVMQATPATWQMLLRAGWSGSPTLNILCGGEALSRDLAAQLIEKGASLWNLYGPTETTIWSTVYRVTTSQLKEHQQETTVSIGKPIANTQTYILDPSLRPVPARVAGDLYIGGAGVARGYCNAPELTKHSFIPHPFSSQPGDRLYRTGDLARYLPDGNLEFLGRGDHQVKIRGFRIELAEIEVALSRHPSVQDGVVTARENRHGDKHLVAYVVLTGTQQAPDHSLRSHLKDMLPEYMIPSAFIVLDRIPLTPNGKLDRRALPEPDLSRLITSTEFVPPRNQTEEMLARIWVDVLDSESSQRLDLLVGLSHRVGRHANFFELGGHSLLAVRLMAEVETGFGQKLPVATLFQAPTIAELATRLTPSAPPALGSAALPLQPKGTRPPFFCIPGAGSHAFYLWHLARALGTAHPFYGLQPPGLEANQSPINKMTDLLAYFQTAVLNTNPQGPYYLGGHSAGGVIGFALALTLQERGYSVPVVTVFDTHPPSPDKLAPIAYMGDHDDTFRDLHEMFEQAFDITSPWHREKLADQPPQEQWQAMAKWFEKFSRLPAQTAEDQLKRMVRLYQSLFEAVSGYTPESLYTGQLVLCLASDSLLDDKSEVIAGWQALCEHAIQVHYVPGNHMTLLRPPYVKILANRLQQVL